MTQHYFTPTPQAASRPRTVRVRLRGRSFTFLTDRGVFARERVDPGTRLLAETMEVPQEGRILDLGCGYGVLGLVAASLAPRARVVLVDVNRRAVELARDNARINGLANVEVHWGDGLEPVRGQAFRLILCNPPYRAGKEVVHRLLDEAFAHLEPGGRLLVVGRTRQGVLSLLRWMQERWGTARELARGGGYRVVEATAPGAPQAPSHMGSPPVT